MRKLLFLIALAILPIFAMAEDEDAPGRVARLSLLQGEVSFAPAGTDEFADAVLNRPLTTGDRLWIDKDARAELQVGSVSIHLDQNSGFSFAELDDNVLRMKLTDGAATVRVRRKLDSETIIVETPNSTVALLHPGEYHLEVNEAGDQTIVKARSGEAAVTGEKDSFVVRADEAGVFKGDHELSADITRLGSRTAFESWANDRDRREENSASAKYVSRDVIGYEDLDDDGDWISEPEYGYVWAPRHVYAGWAPYRDGRWAWVSPWGWTWIDNSRWGFAPFHYGRWAYLSHRSRWCWVPGPRHVRPVYAPALVGWVGSPGVSVSIGIGSGVGWFPLGPREVYVPGYWHSRRYINNVNVSNTVIVNNVYINDAYRGRRERLDYRYRHYGDAVTVISRDSFADGRPIGNRFAPVRDRDLHNWRVDARPPAIAPRSDSIYAGNRATPARDINARFARADRHWPTRSRDSDGGGYAGRVPFDTERRAIESNGGRPVTRSQLSTVPRDRDGQRQGNTFGRAVDMTSATKNNAWRAGDRRNEESSNSDRHDAGQSRGFSIQQPSSAGEPPSAAPENRSDKQPFRQGFSPSWRSQDRGTSRERRETTAPAMVEEAPRSSWRSQRGDSSATFEPRARSESRPAARFEPQREARQERIQTAPARESIHTQQAPQQSGRGNEQSSGRSEKHGSGFSRGGGDRADRSGDGERSRSGER